MAHGGTARPKRLARYEGSLVGDEADEYIMFLCWKELGVDPSDFHDLPWWKLHVAIAGFARERGVDPDDGDTFIQPTLEGLGAAGFTTKQA